MPGRGAAIAPAIEQQGRFGSQTARAAAVAPGVEQLPPRKQHAQVGCIAHGAVLRQAGLAAPRPGRAEAAPRACRISLPQEEVEKCHIIVDQKPRHKAVFQLQRAAQAAVGRMVAHLRLFGEAVAPRQHIAEHASPPCL